MYLYSIIDLRTISGGYLHNRLLVEDEQMRNMRTKTGFMAVLAALLIAFAMMLTIQTDTIYAESDSVPYYCYSLEGTTAVQSNDSCANYAEVTDSNEPVNWRSGWYVVKGSDVHISKRITVSGEANLILCDGATLTAEKGITVAAPASRMRLAA